MGWFDFFKRKKTPDLGVRKASSLGVAKKKKYMATCVIEYNGRDIGKFKATEYGYSRSKVSTDLEKGLKVKLGKIHELKM